MPTTKSDIRKWFYLEGKKNPEYRFMLVVCDTFDYTDYPVFVKRDQDVQKILSEQESNMGKIMECYDLDMEPEAQLDEPFAWHTG